MKMIYILSTLERATQNIYKMGRHTGSHSQLLSRYSTSLINPIIYFSYIVENAVEMESQLKILLYESRISNTAGRKTEWVKMKLHLLASKITAYIFRENRSIRTKKSFTIETKIFTIETKIYEFIDNCFDITNNMDDKVRLSLIMLLLNDYDSRTEKVSLKTLASYFIEKDVKVTKIKGYLTCSGIKLKKRKLLKRELSKKSIDILNKNSDVVKVAVLPKIDDVSETRLNK